MNVHKHKAVRYSGDLEDRPGAPPYFRPKLKPVGPMLRDISRRVASWAGPSTYTYSVVQCNKIQCNVMICNVITLFKEGGVITCNLRPSTYDHGHDEKSWSHALNKYISKFVVLDKVLECDDLDKSYRSLLSYSACDISLLYKTIF